MSLLYLNFIIIKYNLILVEKYLIKKYVFFSIFSTFKKKFEVEPQEVEKWGMV